MIGAVSKQLARLDSKYAGLFNDSMWKESTTAADRLDTSTRFGPSLIHTAKRSVTSDMWCHRKTLTYLLTGLMRASLHR